MREGNREFIENVSFWGGFAIIVFGAVWHFAYQASGYNPVVGLLAPVNESVWEHMKLLAIPLFAVGFRDYDCLRRQVNDLCFALLKELAIGVVVIAGLYYLYSFVLGRDVLVLDVIIFILGVAAARWVGCEIMLGTFKKWEFRGLNLLSGFLLAAIAFFVVWVTLYPPHSGLFKDPISGTYGIYEKR